MTMHGAFWRFPKTFSAANPSGIRVRSAYMKVIGDFALWNDKVVFGCDDSAKSEFLNKRSVKGHIDSVGQSNSNLWFADPALIDKLGPAHASGALWLHETVKEGDQAEPFLIAGWQHRTAWVINHGQDRAQLLIISSSEKVVDVPAKSAVHLEIASDAEWLKAQSLMNTAEISLIVTLTNRDARSTQPDAIFDGLATADSADRWRLPRPWREQAHPGPCRENGQRHRHRRHRLLRAGRGAELEARGGQASPDLRQDQGRRAEGSPSSTTPAC